MRTAWPCREAPTSPPRRHRLLLLLIGRLMRRQEISGRAFAIVNRGGSATAGAVSTNCFHSLLSAPSMPRRTLGTTRLYRRCNQIASGSCATNSSRRKSTSAPCTICSISAASSTCRARWSRSRSDSNEVAMTPAATMHHRRHCSTRIRSSLREKWLVGCQQGRRSLDSHPGRRGGRTPHRSCVRTCASTPFPRPQEPPRPLPALSSAPRRP